MVLVVKDRIKDTSTTSGTGTITLANSPPAGYQAFSTLGNGSTTYYTIQDANDAFEIGLGTYNANTLTRTTVLSSSNSGNLVSLTSGPNTVWVDYPAAKAYLSEEGIDKSFTATAGIAAGRPVILNSAGTVTQVAETITSSYALGAKQTALSNSASTYLSYHNSSIAYDSTSGAVMSVFRASSTQYPTVIAGQYTSSGQITWGTPSVVKSTGGSMYPSIVSGGGKFHITYSYDGSSNVYARWATASGTTITLGNETALNSNSTWGYPVAIWCSDISRLLVAFGNYNQTQAYANILEVTATAYTASSVIGINTNSNTLDLVAQSLTFDSSTNRVLFTYRSSTQFFAKVLTVTTSSISVGTQQLVTDERAGEIATTYDSNINRIIFRYNAGSGSSPSTTGVNFRVIGITGGSTNTISVTSATFSGNSSAFNNKGSGFVFNPDDNITYATLVSLTAPLTQFPLTSTVSGVTVGTGIVIGSATNSLSCRSSSTFNSTKNAVVTVFTEPSATSYDLFSSSYYKNSVTSSNLTSNNYLGVASTSASANASVNINIPGSINNDQVGLTVGQDYYATGQGTILPRSTTTNSPNSNISSSSGYEIASVQNYTRDISVAYDTTNDKIGVLYINNNQYPTIVIAEESNNALTYGTPVVVNSASSNANHSGQKLAYGNGVFVATYNEGNSPVYVKAGSYSGTNSITLGSQIQPNTGTSHFSGGTVAYNPNANKFVFTFAENTTTSIIAYLITNSGTTLTTGNSATITMGYTGNNKVIWNEYDPDTNKQVIMTDHLYGNEGRIYQATISGANITVPSTYYAITDEGTEEDGSKALSYDPDNNKWILFKANTGNVLRANVLTASGDTFTSGTVTQISSQYMRWLAPYYDTEKNKTVLVYMKNTSGYYGEIGFVTISGTTPSFTASATTLGNQTAERVLHNASLYNPDTKSGIVVSATPLSNTKATGYVLYYGTTTSSAINGSQFVGKAISSTQLLLGEEKGNSMAGLSNGAITKGKPVVMQADGDVAQVLGTTTNFSVGTGAQAADPTNYYGSMTYDVEQNKFLLLYRKSSGSNLAQLYYKVGTPNGLSVTWTGGSSLGSYQVNSSEQDISSCYDTVNKKHVVAFRNYNNTAQIIAQVITISGTSASGGSYVTAWSQYQHQGKIRINYASDNGKLVILGYNNNNIFYVMGSVSGTSTTGWAGQQGTSSGTIGGEIASTYDPNTNSIVMAWQDSSNSNYGTSMVGTVGSSSITWGSKVVILSSYLRVYAFNLATDTTTNKIIGAFRNNSTTNGNDCIIGTISGTSISWGTSVAFNGSTSNDTVSYPGVAYDSSNEKFIISYKDNNSSNGFHLTVIEGTLSGNTPTFGSKIAVTQIGSASISLDHSQPVYNSTNKNYTVAGYLSDNDIDYVSVQPTTINTNLTATNYLGMASNTVADNEECIINTQGAVNPDQSSLTAGQLYYVQTDGTLSTTAGSPSVIAGIATSATTLLVTKS